MYFKIQAHTANTGTSSFNLVEYLDKENQELALDERELKEESFFNQDIDVKNTDIEINKYEVINNLDSNRGNRSMSESNFYMLTISPSQEELKHMENLALDELKKRGLNPSSDETINSVFEEQKEQLIKLQLKLYSKDVMNEYANNFNREIYINEEKLPNNSEKKEIEKLTNEEFKKFLKDRDIHLDDDDKLKENSKNYISIEKLNIIEESKNSYLVSLENGKQKADVYISKNLIHKQENGTYKIPENVYEKKLEEVKQKNNLIEINFKNYEKQNLKLKNKEVQVYNFYKNEKGFNNEIKISLNENDLKVKNGKFYTNEHLLNEKNKYAIAKGIEKEFSNEKEKIYNKIATAKGFDLSKRKLNGKDLMWYGKIEKNRTYKFTDKEVLKNKNITQQIKKERRKAKPNEKAIKDLENTYIKNEKGEIIKDGMKKDGINYHAHILVSRHDKTMKNPENKISLSPLANAKDNVLGNGAKIGFDRNKFFEKGEEIFDKKFEFERDKNKTYDYYKNTKKPKQMENTAKSELKQFLSKHTGLNQIKQNISPIQSIKNEIGIANIPTKFPKTTVEAVYKIGRKIIEKGLGY